MSRASSALRAIWASWRAAWMAAVAYRANFLVESSMTLLWVGWTILPMLFIFRGHDGIAGWTVDEALLVTGFFVTLQGLLEAFIEPNLRGLVEDVRSGTLDFVLLKPVDAQLLVSFRRLVPAKLIHALGGMIVVVWATSRLTIMPGPGDVALALLLALSGLGLLYSVWVIVVSTAFWFVRVDNLSYLLGSALDAGRWPVQIFRPALRIVLTFVLPIGLMTTWPAMALRGTLSWHSALLAVGVFVVFLFLSRRVWVFALRHYSSASS
jgi:ABC-2 type transport system permease protein